MKRIDSIEAKAELLSHGFRMSEEAVALFGSPYLYKRRAYGNMDDEHFIHMNVPQEVILLPDGLVTGVILKEDSPWMIDWQGGAYALCRPGYEPLELTFSRTPSFYGMETRGGARVESVLTFMFNHTLGIFVNTSCYFATPERHCRYCSIRCNAARPDDILRQLDMRTTLEAVETAIKNDGGTVNSIFISGGNFTDFDKNFMYYATLALAVQRLVDLYRDDIKVTLNVFSPETTSLLETLGGSGMNLLLSTEVFSEEGFKRFCPGKSAVLPKPKLKATLQKALEVLGENHVYSIVIHGLESDESLLSGVRDYADMGVCTIVNELHLDPGTELVDMNIRPPQPESMLSVAREVEGVYARCGFNSAQAYGGRSSFDREQSLRLFTKR